MEETEFFRFRLEEDGTGEWAWGKLGAFTLVVGDFTTDIDGVEMTDRIETTSDPDRWRAGIRSGNNVDGDVDLLGDDTELTARYEGRGEGSGGRRGDNFF